MILNDSLNVVRETTFKRRISDSAILEDNYCVTQLADEGIEFDEDVKIWIPKFKKI